MKYKFLLFDIDDTLLDFHAAEYSAICLLFDELKIPHNDALISDYSAFNLSLWKQLELGYITKAALERNRFVCFFAKNGIDADGKYAAFRYLHYLSLSANVFDETFDLLEALFGKVRIYAVTNGIGSVQRSRIKLSGIEKYLDGYFISEEVGYQKPRKEFFEAVAAAIPEFNKKSALLIGDSLSSDIMGGVNFEIDTCWYNPSEKKNTSGLKPIYEISDLLELISVLNNN